MIDSVWTLFKRVLPPVVRPAGGLSGGLYMAESSKPALNVAPFPPLRWDDYFWTGRVGLSSWRGFQCRLGAYGAKSSTEASDGKACLSVAPPEGVAERPPAAEQ